MLCFIYGGSSTMMMREKIEMQNSMKMLKILMIRRDSLYQLDNTEDVIPVMLMRILISSISPAI